MTNELLKQIEECNTIIKESNRLREIGNEMTYELQSILKKNFKYYHTDYSGEKNEECIALGYDTYTNNFWLFVNPKNLESRKILSTIYCIKQHLYVNFYMNQNYITISQNDRGYDISRDDLIKLYNHSDRDELLELILSGTDNASNALQILNSKS
jgi:hypothetical protein